MVSIRAPRVRGDAGELVRPIPIARFNPRPSCEGRLAMVLGFPGTRRFNPRPSCEGRRTQSRDVTEWQQFQSAPLV